MTLAELEDTLPNGFHDASIFGVSIDYKRQTATLDPEVPGYRRALAKVLGLRICVVDPPDPNSQYGVLAGNEPQVSGFVTCTAEYWKDRLDPKLVEAAGREAPLDSFFVRNWNSCIHIAATDATHEWTDETT
jgi:hypothetical protein